LFTAEEVGASHKRERLFIMAHSKQFGRETTERLWGGKPHAAVKIKELGNSKRKGLERPASQKQDSKVTAKGRCEVANPSRDAGSRSHRETGRGRGIRQTMLPVGAFPPGPEDNWQGIPEYLWPSLEPDVCELVDGLANDRANYLKLFGNGVVPLQAAYAFLSLWSVARNQ
jgi:hypothetical protein